MSEAMARRYALVTGATSGIGKAFAERLAESGYGIIAVARRDEPLHGLKSDLSSRFGADVLVFPADLAHPETPDRLLEFVKVNGTAVSMLINNAGFGVPGNLCDVEWDKHRGCIEVMATAPVRLCYLFAPLMVAGGGGTIINVSSLSAVLPPHAGGTLYYPVKSFLYQFSLAFRAEMRTEGVRVTTVCPGFTDTNFQKAAGGTVESVAVPKWLWSSPEAVAKAALAAARRNQPVSIPGLFNKATAVFFKLVPASIGRWVVS
jgi:short-subunit dehydrogenase